MQFDWLDIVGNIFELVIFPALSAATIYFITWLKAKKQELQKKIKNEANKKYTDMLEKTIIDCVLATNQTFVKSLKQSGTFDDAAQKRAFQLTFDSVMGLLTDEAKAYLCEIYADLSAYITTKIEASIKAAK